MLISIKKFGEYRENRNVQSVSAKHEDLLSYTREFLAPHDLFFNRPSAIPVNAIARISTATETEPKLRKYETIFLLSLHNFSHIFDLLLHGL